MDQHGVPAVLLVKAPGRIAEEHHGKFHALGFVDGHDLHRALLRAAGGGLQSLFRLAAKPQHKAVQPPIAAALKALGQLNQLHQVCPALLSVGHGAAEGQHIQLVQQPPHQLTGGHIRRHITKLAQFFPKAAAFFVVLRRGAEGGVEVLFPVLRPYGGQLIGAEAEAGGAQNRDQRDVLVGIVDNRQHGHHGGDLHRAEKASALAGAHRDAVLGKGTAVHPAHVVYRAEQNGNVAVFDGPLYTVVRHCLAGIHQLPYLFRHHGGLQGGLVRGLLVLRRAAQLQQHQLRRGHAARILGAGDEPCLVVIVDVAQPSGHAAAKHPVCRLQHLPAGTEVLAEDNAPGLSRCGGIIVRVAQIFFGEDLRIRQTEAVNGLLYVPHQEKVFPLPGDGVEDGVLHPAHVLVFVHHDLRIALGELHGQRTGAAVLLREEPGGHVLQIRVVHQGGAALFFGKLPVKIQCQLQQGLHGRRGVRHLPQELF